MAIYQVDCYQCGDNIKQFSDEDDAWEWALRHEEEEDHFCIVDEFD